MSPILSGVIVTFALVYYSSEQWKINIAKDWPVVAHLMDTKPILVLCVAAVWAPLISVIKNWLDENRRDCLEVQAPVAHYLLNCLDDVVGFKAIRFKKTVCDIERNGNSKGPQEIFNTITQPHAQIEQLTQAILTFFNCLNDHTGNQLRVSLLEVDHQGLPAEFVTFFPRNLGPRSSTRELRHAESAVCVAANRKKIHIVSDIKREGHKKKGRKQFRITDSSRADEDGSMFCYPIMHPIHDECAMVISVSCNTAGHFRKDHKHLYEFAMQRFEHRMQLEYTLSLLKQ